MNISTLIALAFLIIVVGMILEDLGRPTR